MKKFNTLEEQIEKLKSRGVEFKDIDNAKDYLLRNNYYNVINICSKPFVDEINHYKKGTTFSEIIAVHQFEKEIKHAIFKFLIEAEQHLKTIVAYTFCKYHQDPYDCINISSYNMDQNMADIAFLVSNNAKIINRYTNLKSSNSIKHYVSNHNDVPYWVLCSYLSFGNIISIYSLMKNKEKREIINSFEIYLNKNLGTTKTLKIKNSDFAIMLNCLLELRNIVAHNNKIFNFKTRENISYIKPLHDKYNIKNTDSKQNFYNMMVILNCFLTPVQYAQMYNTVIKRCKNLNKKLSTIESNKIFRYLGLPDNFHTYKKIPQ